jgi:hypothetical protein
VVIALLLCVTGLAFAQDPGSDAAAAVEDDDVYEIIVYDDVAAEFARQAVVERLGEIGYSERIERNGYVIYRHPDNWRGDVRLYDEGYVRIRRQPVQIEPIIGKPGTPLGTASCVLLLPLCARLGGQTVGRRKLQAQKTGIAQFLDPEMDVWGDRIADREVGSRIAMLPDDLEKLWFEGVALEGGEDAVAVVGPDDKKAMMLAFWDSRTNTVWGNRVRLTVEGFIRAIVQNSDTPFTGEELTAFNATRASERQLDLTSPWDAVAEGL